MDSLNNILSSIAPLISNKNAESAWAGDALSQDIMEQHSQHYNNGNLRMLLYNKGGGQATTANIIIACVVSGVAAIIIGFFLVRCLIRRKRQQQNGQQPQDQKIVDPNVQLDAQAIGGNQMPINPIIDQIPQAPDQQQYMELQNNQNYGGQSWPDQQRWTGEHLRSQ